MNIKNIFKSLTLLLVLYTGCINLSFAHILVKEEISLLEAIEKISKEYEVYFTFDMTLVTDVRVEYEHTSYQSAEEAIADILKGTKLQYKFYDHRFVILYKEDAEGLESLRKMSQHLDGLISEGERSINTSPKQKVRTAPFLSRTKLSKTLVSVTFSVVGTVVDQHGEPLIGVNIQIKGTNEGTATDLEGKFVFEDIDENAVLVVSYIGYQTLEVPVSGKSELTITLISDSQLLEEVVVVGYGTQIKTNITGSIKQLSGEELFQQSSIQTSASIMGKVAGVQVIQNSGQPGENYGTIKVRGIGNLDNSDPLVLIDGIPGDLNNIPTADIENLTVLKDASAAAVYGSRAANGVILITTKRGSAGSLQLSYGNLISWQKPTNHPEFVDGSSFMRLQNLGAENLGMQPIWSEEYISNWERNYQNDPDNYPSTNWVEEAFTESGLQQRHTLGISGGNETIKTLGSLTYDNETSALPNYGFKRYSIRLNTDLKLKSNLDINFDINLIRKNQVKPTTSISTIITDIYRIPSVYVSKYSHGGWGPAFNLNNPIAYIHDGGLTENIGTIASTRIGLNYSVANKINFKLVYSPYYNSVQAKSSVKQYEIHDKEGNVQYKVPGINSLSQNYGNDLTHNINGIIQYDNEIKHHKLVLLAGYENISFKDTYIYAFRDQFQLQDFEQLNAGSIANQQNRGNSTEWALQSLFTRFNYSYKSKYLFEANLRYDGSSRFTRENRWGAFPSFSAGWIASEETFMNNLDFLNVLKLRTSWGVLGNQQIGTYPFASIINLNQSFIFGDNPVPGAAQLGLANQNITWEETTSTNLGLDISMLDYKLNITFDVFDRKTSDILLELPVPLILGLNAPFQNAGEVNNRGWELDLNYREQVNTDVFFQVGFILSDVKNEVVNLRGTGPYISGSNGSLITAEGEPIGSLYGYQSVGFFNSYEEIAESAEQPGHIAPGDIKYVDQNNDGIINSNDKVIIGDPFPSLNYGFTISAKIKYLDISLFFQGVGRRDVYLSDYATWPFYNGSNLRKWQADNFWTPENHDASMPRFTPGTTHSNFTPSSFWVYNANYLRMRNIQIGYSLDSSRFSKINLNRVRLYVMGENLFTLFDKLPQGVDPNVPNGSTYFPINRLLGFGLDIQF